MHKRFSSAANAARANKIGLICGSLVLALAAAGAQASSSLYPDEIRHAGEVVGAGTTNPYLTRMVTADFNGDGLTDLAAPNDVDAVLVFLAVKGGGFAKPIAYETIDVPYPVAAGDLDGDGDIDIVVGSRSGSISGVSVLLNNGDGTFQPHKDYDYGGSYAENIVVGDADGDGDADVVVYDTNLFSALAPTIYVLPGAGDGTLSTATMQTVTPSSPEGFEGGLSLADVNGDNRPDIVAVSGCNSNGAGQNVDNVDIFAGAAGGTFPSAPSQSMAVGSCPSLATGDVNGDGIADIVVERIYKTYDDNQAGITSPAVQVILGGADSLAIDHSYPIAHNPLSATSLNIADADGDGHPDVIINSTPVGVQVMYGAGDGNFETPAPTSTIYGREVTALDLNGDGLRDLVGLMYNGLLVSRGLGQRQFLNSRQFTHEDDTGAGLGAHDIIGADFNGDGTPDVATVNDDGTLSLLMNDGSGSFGAPTIVALGTAPMRAIAGGDFNEDGMPDIAAVNDGGVFFTGISNGDGTFVFTPGSLAVSGTVDIATGDINADGHADLVFAENGGNQIEICVGGGHGFFGCSIHQPVIVSKPDQVAVADLNGDHKADLIVTTATADATVAGATDAYVWLNNGLGGFGTSPSVTLPVPGDGAGIAVGDVNGDGIADIVFGSDGDSVTIFIGHGAGTFGAPTSLPVGAFPPSSPSYVALADVNGDGAADIIAQALYGNLSVLTNNGDGTFTSPAEFAARPGPLLTLDMDGDGLIDMAVAGSTAKASPYYTEPMYNAVGIYLHNHAPTVTADDLTVAENGTGSGTLQAADVELDRIGFALAVQPSHGKATLDAATGAYTYTPVSDYSGADSFTIAASDGTNTTPVKVSVTVTAPPPPPPSAPAPHTSRPAPTMNGSGGGGAWSILGILFMLAGLGMRGMAARRTD